MISRTRCMAYIGWCITGCLMGQDVMAACVQDGGRFRNWGREYVVKQHGRVGDPLVVFEDRDPYSAASCAVGDQLSISAEMLTLAGFSYDAAAKRMNTNLDGVALEIQNGASYFNNQRETALNYSASRVVADGDGTRVPGTNLVRLVDSGINRIRLVRTKDTIEVGALSPGRLAEFNVSPGSVRYRRIENTGVRLVAASCSIRTSDLNQRVQMGKHTVNDIVRSGSTAWTEFALTSEDCSAANLLNAQYTFKAPAAPGRTDLFDVRAGSSTPSMNVGLEIEAMPASGNVVVKPGVPIDVPSLDGGQQYRFRARLRSLPGVTPTGGVFSTPVQVNVDFM